MTTIRKIVTSKIDGNDANSTSTDEIRPFGETAFYIDSNWPLDKLTLMIFDGIRNHRDSKVLAPGILWGSGADAGDGSGADTIKLIPDAEILANGSNQYIIVDPTGGEPGHIHLRAGGPQDASAADLYLGGELTCVRVSDTSGSVIVRTTNIGDPNMTMNWSFQRDGNLYFPGLGNNRIGESEPGLVVSSSDGVVLQSNNNGESNEWLFNTDGTITFPDGTQQMTSWTGGRVVSVPASSTGASGDLQGDLAFNGSHIYYCIADFGSAPTETFTVTNVGENSNVIRVNMASNPNYTVPQAGWYVVLGGVTMTLTAFSAPNLNGVDYDFLFDVPSGPLPSTVTLTSSTVYTNIWKRLAWSSDTW